MRAKPLALAAGLLLATTFVSPAPAARAQSGRGGKNPVFVETQGNASAFSGQRAYQHVKRLVEFGPRPSGSKELALARKYILEQLGGGDGPRLHARGAKEITLNEDEWTADTPSGKLKMVNIVYELPGETDDTIVIAGHYDTKRYKEFAFVGANDGGSSAGALIEIARTLRDSGARDASPTASSSSTARRPSAASGTSARSRAGLTTPTAAATRSGA